MSSAAWQVLKILPSYFMLAGCSSLDEFYFNTQPEDLIVERHQTVLWDCNAQGEEPISYTWYYKGVGINDSSRRILENGTLKIVDVSSRRDIGNYSCCATNPLGVLCGVNVSLSVASKLKRTSLLLGLYHLKLRYYKIFLATLSKNLMISSI